MKHADPPSRARYRISATGLRRCVDHCPLPMIADWRCDAYRWTVKATFAVPLRQVIMNVTEIPVEAWTHAVLFVRTY